MVAGLELNDFQGLLRLLPFDLGLLAGIALDRRRPAGLAEHLFTRVDQILTIEPVLESWALIIRSANRSERPGISSRTPAVEQLNAAKRALVACSAAVFLGWICQSVCTGVRTSGTFKLARLVANLSDKDGHPLGATNLLPFHRSV